MTANDEDVSMESIVTGEIAKVQPEEETEEAEPEKKKRPVRAKKEKKETSEQE